MRRLAAMTTMIATVSAVAASPAVATTAGQPIPPPPHLYLIIVQDNGFGECVPIPYGDDDALLNQYVEWWDQWPGDVMVNEVHGFWSFPMTEDDDIFVKVPEAGTFEEECSGPHGHVVVEVSVPASTTNPNVRVRWAAPSTPSTHVYSVQYKMGIKGTVKSWKKENAQKTAVFAGHHGHAYFFRAESFIDHDHHSDWSPWARVVVH